MTSFFSRKTISSLTVVAVFALLLFSALPASAQINAGYDLLQTGSGASIDLSSAGLGTVPLQGNPWDTSLGSTDTIMNRTQNIPSTGGSSNVAVTAIFMKSKNSVTLNGQAVDVYVTLNNSGGKVSTSTLPQPDSLSASSGSVTVRSDGTFDSNITVNADVIFVKAGTSVTNSANWVSHQAAPSVTLTSSGSSWSSTPPAGYPSSSTFSPGGGFYPRPVHNGPHPVIPASCGSGTTNATQPTSATAQKAGTATSTGGSGQLAVKACITSAQVSAQ
jgi:hypothetical protein